MSIYKITVFEKNGEKLLDESIEAKNDVDAKRLGEKLLSDKGFQEKTHRLVSPEGKLLLFHI